DARVTLIRSGIQPTLLGRQAMPWDQAQSALADWQPQAPRHDFASAWDEAARIVGVDGEFLFLTDRIDEQSATLPLGMEVVSVGRRLPNVALSTARWTFNSQSGEGTLFVRISNYGSAAVNATLRGTANEQTIFEQQIALDAESAAPFEVSVPGGIGRLTLSVDVPGDGLAVDNTVTLVEPKVRLLSVAVTLPDDSAEQRLVQRALA